MAAEKHLAEVEGDSDFDEDLAAVTGKEIKDKKKTDGKMAVTESDDDMGSDIDYGSEEEGDISEDEDMSEGEDGSMSEEDEDMSDGEDSNMSREDEDNMSFSEDLSDDAPEGMSRYL